MRWTRRIAWAFAAAILLAAVMGAAAALWIGTGAGRAWVASQVNRALVGQARVTGIGGSLPFHPEAGAIELLDADGVWARLEDVRLDLVPADLLRRRVTVSNLSARSVDVLRQPVPGATPAPTPAQSSLQALRQTKLPSVDLQKLTIGTVILPPDLLGAASRWSVRAQARLISGDVRLDLDIVGSEPAPVTIAGQVDLAGDRLSINAHVADSSGFLLHRAVGQGLPLRIDLSDDPASPHTLADWHGRAVVSVGDCGRLDALLHLTSDRQGQGLETEGKIANACDLPAGLKSLVGGDSSLHARLRATGDTDVAIEELKLETPALRAEGAGTYHPDGGDVDVTLHVEAADLGPFSGLAGRRLAGAARVDLHAEGPIEAPHAGLDVHATALSYGDNTADGADAHLVLIASPARGYAFDGQGEVLGARTTLVRIPPELGSHLSWAFAGRSDAALDKVTFATLNLSSAGSTLAWSGSFDRRSQEVAGAVSVHAGRLAQFSDLAGFPLDGRGQLTATVQGAISGPIRVQGNGRATGLVSGIAALDALTGGTAAFGIDARRAADGSLALEIPSLRLGHVDGRASATLDPGVETVAGTIDARIDDLSALRRAGLPAAGQFSLHGVVGGTVRAPTVDARLEGSGLAWAKTSVERAGVDLHAAVSDAPSGTITGQFVTQGAKITVAAAGALSADRRAVTVTRAHMAAGANAVDARLRIALDTLLTTGQVTAKLPDLASLSSFVGQKVAGRGDLKLVLAAQGGQGATLSLTADDLQAESAGAQPLHVHHLETTAVLTDLLRHPGGHLDGTVQAVSAAGIDIQRMHIAARTLSRDRIAVEGDARGDFKGPFTIAYGGEVAQERDGLRATINRIDGRAADTPLRLQRPVMVAIHGSSLTVGDLALAVGGATVSGSVKTEGEAIDLKLEARDLPVTLARPFTGSTDLGGTVDARVAIAGPAAQPRGNVSLQGHQLRIGPARRGAPIADIAVVATLAPGKVDLAASVDVAGHPLASAKGSVPVTFGPRLGMVALDDRGPMSLNVEGDADLAAFLAVLPTGGNRVAGHVHLAVDGSGSLAQPRISGSVSLDHGRYEDPAIGLVIDALALDVEADGDRVTVRHLTASDGADGRLEGQGGVSLASGAAAGDLEVTLQGFRALQRNDANLTASGTAHLTGTLESPVLHARLTVDKSEFTLADPLPPSAQQIPVTVIDSSTGRVLERPAADETSSATSRLRLDIVVHVPNRTFVRGRGLASEWRGDIQVQGTSASPDVTGALNVVNGTLSFFGKDMTLTRGTVRFIGGRKIEPDLDVVAETTTADATFDVAVKGTPDDVKITLSSNPEMPRDEILAHLIFGSDVTRLTPQQGIQLAQAAVTLADGGEGVLDKVRRKLGLDVFSVGSMNDNNVGPVQRSEVTNSSNSGMSNTGVNAGKYVANGVYVGAEQGVSGETRSKIQVEILPHVNIVGEAGTRSDNVGINWQTDY